MSTISWFEIPTKDIERAQKFYEAIFQTKLINMDNPMIKMRTFPFQNMMTEITGALVHHPDFYKPTDSQGTLIYLNANPDLHIVLNRVEENGGKILRPKTQISEEFGYMGLFIDTEGNRIGLHSMQ